MNLKKFVLIAGTMGAMALSAQAQTIAQWDFEGATTPPDLNNSATSPVASASFGTGTVLGVHASAATDWTTPVGPGSANSFSSNTWAVNDYWEISLSTTGFIGITLSFDAIGSGTGPRDFTLAYSTDGTNFFNFTTYSLVENASPNTWSGMGGIPAASHYSFDLSSITDLDNAASVFFRLINSGTDSTNGGTVGAGGTSRIDNITVAAVPEPTTIVLLLGAGLICRVSRRKRVIA